MNPVCHTLPEGCTIEFQLVEEGKWRAGWARNAPGIEQAIAHVKRIHFFYKLYDPRDIYLEKKEKETK